MASRPKIKQEDILKAAFEILKAKGIAEVNARDIAKNLNSSVQPIFYRFKNMNDLKEHLLQYSLNYYKNFLFDIKGKEPKYKEIGLNYIRFAKENHNIFKFIFMGNHHIKIEEFAYFDNSYREVEKILKIQNDISYDEVKKIHLQMWIFTHGIASLIATNTCILSDEEISTLLTEQFYALLKNINSKRK